MTERLARTIPKSRVNEWLQRLLAGGDVIAPTLAAGGDVMFAPVDLPEQVEWDFTNPLQPPKRFLLPQTDPIVAIRRDNGHMVLAPLVDDRPRVLLNVRSCDVAAMAYLRRVQAADLPDAAVLRRASCFTLVSLACSRPCPLGFCVCCDAGPFLATGFDVQLTDLGDRLLAEVGSEKGSRLLVDSCPWSSPAGADELRERQVLEEGARRAFGEETCHFGSAMRRISTGRVADALWERMSLECFDCGGCNFACPTCACFSVGDRRCEEGWDRCRRWDSCQYKAFTLEASGHNPREQRKDRMKRRFFHKVSAQYYQRDEAVGCVGCGRCVTVCLGTTDMPAVVAAIRQGAWHG